MKTIEDLKRLREQFQGQTKLRNSEGVQIIIGMGTCGIAAGAREVMSAIMDELAKRKLQDVTIRQTGCIGMCEKEVLVDVVRLNLICECVHCSCAHQFLLKSGFPLRFW